MMPRRSTTVRTRSRPTWLAVALTVTSLACALVGCGEGSPSVESPQATAPPTTPDVTESAAPVPSGSATETEEPVPFPANIEPDTADASADAALLVTDIRTGAHDGYDRVVFELSGTGTPGWRVSYVDVATDDPSDRELDIAGDGTLQVTIVGTAMPVDAGTAPWAVGPVLTPEDPVLREVNYRGWFEGQDLAFLGLDAAGHPFRVFTLTDPTRLVVDVRHDA